MVIQVNVLIYIYMYICVCLLIFNLFYVAKERFGRKRDPKKEKRFMDSLTEALQMNGTAAVSKNEEKVWLRKLNRCSNLIIFQQAVDDMTENGEGERVEEWIRNNKNLFFKLCTAYMKRGSMEKAFMAYIVEQHRLCGPGDKDPFAFQMKGLMMERSIYCRQNALYALYAGGQAIHVVKAYSILSRLRIEHSAKMVTDGLLYFKGNRKLLAEELWNHWSEFTDYYKICFVNFFRMISGNFTERLMTILENEENDRELRFAAIRYFRRYKYDEAGEYMCRLVDEWRESDWEYAALAALALETYPGGKSVAALKSGYGSRSWYIRYNCVQTLEKMISREEKEELIQSANDRYTKEMMEYQFAGKGEAVG